MVSDAPCEVQVGNCVTWIRQLCPWECSVSEPKWYKAHVAVIEKFTITNILNVVIQLQLEFCKVFSIYLNIPQTKIIITSFRTAPNPFQHEVCQTVKAQKIF